MRFDPHVGEDASDDSLLIDQIGDSFGVPLIAERPIGLNYLLAGVRQKGKVQAVFLGKGLMRGDVVGADAEDLDIDRSEFIQIVSKAARLLGAAGRVVLGVKVEDDVFLPQIIRPMMRLSILVLK